MIYVSLNKHRQGISYVKKMKTYPQSDGWKLRCYPQLGLLLKFIYKRISHKHVAGIVVQNIVLIT